MPAAGAIRTFAARLSSVLSVALFASLGIALLVGTQVPVSPANRLFIGLIALLIAWPVLGLWLASTERLTRSTALVLALTAIIGGLLAAMPS